MAKSRLSKLKDKVAKKLPKLPKLPKLNRAEKLAALGTAVSVGTAIYTLSQQNGSGSNRSANTDGGLSINKDELINLIKSDTTLQNLLRGATGANGLNGAAGTNGAAGANGVNGNKIYAVTALPSNSNDVQVYQNGDLMLNTSTGILYEKSSLTPAQFLVQNSQSGIQGIVLANVVFLTKGNLKGANGNNGINGIDGTKIYCFNTLLEFEENVSLTDYRINDLFLITESGILYKKTANTIPPNATNQAFYTTVMNLKGDGGNGFHSLLKIEYSDFITHQFSSADYLNFTVSTDFALLASSVNNNARFVAFIYNNQSELWDRLEITIDEVINNGVNYEMSIIMPFGFENGIEENLWNLTTLKIFLAGFDYLTLPSRDKKAITDVVSNSFTDFQSWQTIRLMSGFNSLAFYLPAANVNQLYRNKSFKFLRIQGGMVEFIDNNIQDTIYELTMNRSVEFYCDAAGNWKVIDF